MYDWNDTKHPAACRYAGKYVPVHHRLRNLLLLGMIMGLVPAALAQEAAKEPNWAAIRKTGLAAIDRNTTQRWLDATIQDLLTNEQPKVVQQNGSEFYKKMMAQYKASEAVQAFKVSLAELVASTFSQHYQPSEATAKPPHPLGASVVLMVLRDFAHPSALPCFKTALRDSTPGPRFMAAEGLAAIQGALNDQDWTVLIADLQKAAGQETNNPTLHRLYQLFFAAGKNANRTDAAVTAVMATLDNRTEAFEQKDRTPLRADAEALAWLAARAEQSNNATLRIDVTQRAARLLADAAYAYLNNKLTRDLSEPLEETISQVETRLEGLARAVDRNLKTPGTSVRAALQAGGEDRADKMTAAVTQWIGSGETQGVLNQQPFRFPVGLNINRKTTATTTAAAP